MAGNASKPIHPLPLYEGPHQARLQAWVQLARAFHLVYRRVVSALAEHDVTVPQFDILATLRFGEGLTQQELAQRLLVTKGNVCGVLDRLEQSDWVQRRPDPADGRSNRLYLTAAGRRKVDGLLPAHDALVVQAMAALSHADVLALRRLLEVLATANENP